MNQFKDKKCVLIIDASLPHGQQANVAAVLAMTIGGKHPDIVGEAVSDGDGICHEGITQLNLPILSASTTELSEIFKIAVSDTDIMVVDFNDIAQSSRSYDEYISRMNVSNRQDITYIGMCLLGNKKQINKLTGNLRLLR